MNLLKQPVRWMDYHINLLQVLKPLQYKHLATDICM